MARAMTPVSPLQRYIRIRRKIYFFVITAGIICIFFPFIVHAADIFKNDVIDVYREITDNVTETNDILNKAFKFCKISPYTVLNTYSDTVSRNVHSACQSLAVVIATFLLLVDFFKKATAFEWASKWENVLIFLIKVIVVKQVIQNADVIVSYVYALFDWLNQKAFAAVGSNLLPCGNAVDYDIYYDESLLKDMWEEGAVNGWVKFFEKLGAGELGRTFRYHISWDAVHMFFPNAVVMKAGQYDYTAHAFAYPTSTMFQPTIKIILMQPYFLVMKAIAYMIFVIAIGRVFELCIYTLFAPLPLATFAGDGTHDVAKSFIKNYIATVLQIATIIVMFTVYLAMNSYFVNAKNGFADTPLIQFIVLISLGLGVIKSGTWARKICGAA